MADALSRLSNGESATGVLDQLPDARLFHIGATWMGPLIEYLKTGRPPRTLTKNERVRLALKALPFTMIEGKLYRLGQDNVLRKCLDYDQGK